MIKDLVLAAWFGTNVSLDAYLIALAIPLFVTTVIAGSFNSALVPTYISVRHSNRDEAARLLASITMLAAIILAMTSAVLLLAGPFLVRVFAAKCGPEELRIIQDLFPYMLPIVLANGMSVLLGGILNANDRFALPAITPALASLVPLSAYALPPEYRSIKYIAIATIAGYVAETVVLCASVVKQGVLAPSFAGTSNATSAVLRAYAPMFAGMLVSCASPVIDQFMASRLGEGAVATLSFAGKVPSFVMALCAGAVGAAVLPFFSRLAADSDWDGIRAAVRVWAALIIVATIPVVVLCELIAPTLIRLLFERGAFGPHDTAATVPVFRAFLPQIPFYVLGILGCRLLSALQHNRLLMLFAAFNVVVNFVTDFAFMRMFGLPGIALSTSLVYLVSAVLVFTAVSVVRAKSARTSTVAS